VVSAAQVLRFRGAIGTLTLAATGQANSAIRQAWNPNPETFRDNLIEVTPAILQPSMTAAAQLAAVFYEDARREAVRGMYLAREDDSLPQGLVDGMVRYAVAPAFGQSDKTVLSLLAAGLQKAIAGASRNTIAANVQRDRTKVAYARVPSAGCCAFCAMLASRGAAYTSEESAGDGDKYHSFCRCVATPVWEGQRPPYDVARFEAIYAKGIKDGSFDLSNIREATGRA